MKKSIFTIVLFLMGLLTSCNYLDVVPEGKATTDDIWRTAAQAETFVYTLYDDVPDRFHIQYLPDICAGGDYITGWYGAVRYFSWKSLVYNDTESASSSYFRLWDPASSGPTGASSYYIYRSIRNCYYFLNNIKSVPDITEEQLKYWTGEAYYLIAYYHQTLLEYYGPVVLVKSEVSFNAGADETYPARSTYDECVDFIAENYKKAIDLLPPQRKDPSEYGRATAAAAYGQLARLYLYAASPLVNGNTEFYANFKNKDGKNLINQVYDKEKWKKAMDTAKEAIAFCEQYGYSLFEKPGNYSSDAERGKANYHGAFIGLSSTNSVSGSSVDVPYNFNEILFGLTKQSTISYVAKNIAPRIGYTSYNSAGFRGYLIPTWDAVEMYYSKNGLPMDVDPETKDLNLYSVATGDSTALLNRNREPRFYASIGYDRGLYEVNGGIISIHSRYKEPQGYDGNSNNEYQSNNGYFCQKYICANNSYKVSTKVITDNKFVYPYLRLAELYLDYAEAEFEYNGTLDSYALYCLNKVRKRSGLPNFEDSWAKVGGIPTGSNLRTILHKERSIEFLMEGRRYHDIRRWKTAGEVMTREWKSWNLTGKTAADFYQVTTMKEGGTRTFTTPKTYWWAIPLTEINTNYNVVQNPGY